MTKLIGISGSLRHGSFNTALLHAAAKAMPDGAELKVAAIRDIPLYDQDVEDKGIPAPVAALKDAIAASDGLLIVTPEYNNSMPGVLKNAVDWLTRPPSDIARVFRGRPVALMGATPGNWGTVLAQNSWLPVLRTLGTEFWSEGRLLVPRAQHVFAADGGVADPNVAQQLRGFMQGFVAFAQSARRANPRA